MYTPELIKFLVMKHKTGLCRCIALSLESEHCDTKRHQESTSSSVSAFQFLLYLHPLRKGYRTDATVSVLLGFLLFLIPARRPFSSSSSSSCRDTGQDHSLIHLSVSDKPVPHLVYVLSYRWSLTHCTV